MKIMKSFLSLVMSVALLFGMTSCNDDKKEELFLMCEYPTSLEFFEKSDNFKGVWISYLEIETYFKDKNETDFTNTVTQMFQRVKDKNLNAVVMQVRSNSEALYPSAYYSWSYHISTNGASLPYDPMSIMVKVAHDMGLSFHCWINPFRIMKDSQLANVSAEYKIKQWYANPNYMKQGSDGFWYFNPGNDEVIRLILDGVLELVKNYDVDGIHIDDYFYAKVLPSDFGQTDEQGRENTTKLVKSMYDTIKAEDKSVVFGVSPAGGFGDMPTSDVTQLTNLTLWCKEKGYIDYVAPQIYWNFEASIYPFGQTVQKWESFMSGSEVKLYIGLADYKYNGTGEIEKQVSFCNDSDMVDGYIHYRYDNLG